jgi:3-oxoadipate enol-lactonase
MGLLGAILCVLGLRQSTVAAMFRTVRVAGAQVEYDQRGAGPQLLLIHSLLTELTVFDRVLPELAAARRVTRINLPGFGASAPLPLHTVAEHAGHVARVMDGLELPRDTAVFGNGFGAFVALELAIRRGERFGRLIVADTLAAFPEPARAPFRAMAERVRAGGMAAVLDTAIARMFPPAFGAQHPELIAERKAALAAVEPQCFARACLALADLDLAAQAPQIENPTLVLCGELDQTTPPALARELASLIPGARYEGIAESGHCPMLEQPALLTDKVQRFLAR